jgi:hypothetical protein
MERPEWFPRFESYISHEALSGCWLWAGEWNDGGYGRLWIRGKNHQAHRLSYELHKGPIPDGLTIDHLCRVRCCVNPDHLEPVTMRENTLRGTGPTALNVLKTSCPAGHLYTPDNTRIDARGRRSCRECDKLCSRLTKRRWRARLRALGFNERGRPIAQDAGKGVGNGL